MEFDAESQYVEVAVNGGMDTLLNIDDRQLFVCDVNYKIIEEEYIKESNEGADKRHGPQHHDEFSWDDVNN